MEKIVLALTAVLAVLSLGGCKDNDEKIEDVYGAYTPWQIQFLDEDGNNLGESIEVSSQTYNDMNVVTDYYTIEGMVNGEQYFEMKSSTRSLPPEMFLTPQEKAFHFNVPIIYNTKEREVYTAEFDFCCPKIWGDGEGHKIRLERNKEYPGFAQWNKVVVEGKDITHDVIDSGPDNGTIYRYVVKSAQ